MPRPRYAVKRFRKARIAKLPAVGTAHSYARALGVRPNTVLSWLKNEGLPFSRPLPGKGNAYRIKRIDLLAFLRDTRRFKIEGY